MFLESMAGKALVKDWVVVVEGEVLSGESGQIPDSNRA